MLMSKNDKILHGAGGLLHEIGSRQTMRERREAIIPQENRAIATLSTVA